MARNEDFHNGFWDHPDIDGLSAEATLLYIWSWTNPRCGMAGLYHVGRGAMIQSKVQADRLDTALQELQDAGLAFYEDGALLVVKRTARLRTKSPQMAKSAVKDLAAISPDHPLRGRWLEIYAREAWLTRALTEAQVSLTNTSEEVQKPDEQRDLVSLTNTSQEPHPRLLVSGMGRGKGSGRGNKDTTTVDAGAGLANTQHELPDDFPERFASAARDVLSILLRVHARRGGTDPTLLGVGLAITAFPDRDHRLVASALEHWALAGLGRNSKPADWVRTFRTFLERSPSAQPLAKRKQPAEPQVEIAPARKTDKTRWARIAAELQTSIEPAIWEVWLAPLHPHASTADRLVLGCPDQAVGWVRERFGRTLAAHAETEVVVVACQCKPARKVAA